MGKRSRRCGSSCDSFSTLQPALQLLGQLKLVKFWSRDGRSDIASAGASWVRAQRSTCWLRASSSTRYTDSSPSSRHRAMKRSLLVAARHSGGTRRPYSNATRDSLKFAQDDNNNNPNYSSSSNSSSSSSSSSGPSPDQFQQSIASTSAVPYSTSSTTSPRPSTSQSNTTPNEPGLVLSSTHLPQSPHTILALPRLPFSTHRFVRNLENAGMGRGMAEGIMKATRGLLLRHEEEVAKGLLSKSDLENVSPFMYHYLVYGWSSGGWGCMIRSGKCVRGACH